VCRPLRPGPRKVGNLVDEVLKLPGSSAMFVCDGQVVCDLCCEDVSSWFGESTAEGDCVLAGSQSDQRPIPVCREFAVCGLGDVRNKNVVGDRREMPFAWTRKLLRSPMGWPSMVRLRAVK
jgi:hypothetical protein